MTTHKEFYYILTFNTTTDAMCADKCAKENTNGIRAALMPLPQEFKSGCGFALRFLDDNLEAILKFCKTSPFNRKKRISINRNTLLSFFCTFLIMVTPAGGAGFSVKDNHIKVLS